MSKELIKAREEWESKFGGGRLIRWDDFGSIEFKKWDDGETFIDTRGNQWSARFGCRRWNVVKEAPAEADKTPEKALNYCEGKPRPSLILRDMPKAFNELLKVREFGANKYPDRLNFRASIGKEDSFLNDNMDSIERHLMAHERGEVIDAESECYHLAQVAVRCMFALEYLESEK